MSITKKFNYDIPGCEQPTEPIKGDDSEDIMTLEEFKECCQGGLFIDSDGTGVFATNTHKVKIHCNMPWDVKDYNAYPSSVVAGDIPERATHVVWYNK